MGKIEQEVTREETIVTEANDYIQKPVLHVEITPRTSMRTGRVGSNMIKNPLET